MFQNKGLLLIILFGFLYLPGYSQKGLSLENGFLKVKWTTGKNGYQISAIQLAGNKSIGKLSGEYTVLYSANKPDSLPQYDMVDERAKSFPEPVFKYIVNNWKSNIGPVPLNTAGKAIHFFPEKAVKGKNSSVSFNHSNPEAKVSSVWSLDEKHLGDIQVEITLTAQKPGYFSIATPSFYTIPEEDLEWGIIPGHLQGKSIEKDLVLSYGYGQGIPDKPIIVRERTATTLAPVLENKAGFSLAVIPTPGTGRDPWEKDKNTHNEWHLGLSLMNRKSQLTPTAYHPILGETGSYLKTGEKITFSFRYSMMKSDWYQVYKHAINDIYQFKDFLSLKETNQSLTNRILSMHNYLLDDSTSMWRVEKFQGKEIGAQAYLGDVVGADKDAMKNSDYGAMWMLATITGDSVLKNTRLPYARNFKLTQQQEEEGFYQGAAVGQYYLSKSKRFAEEWGSYVEPIGLTYYTMLDIGNILLFQPEDEELKERLKLGADKLLEWQNEDGHWEVAYDRETEQPRFSELKDLRPTFYGLVVAYKILGDQKYLDAAKKGADWFVKNAAEKGNFLGVCGDMRYLPDFATGQSVQALLDLFEITNDKRYQEAAIKTARVYTASVYTHPVPSKITKVVKGKSLEDWQISQTGLSFEHGGSIGSATIHGPILLASHAGMFVRMFRLTNDSLFIDMARAAAWGRDAFVDPKTSVASYYWRTMNAGAGPFPHHAWWQIGWITDYLLSETALRSAGKISFPRGFITPKVGPHQTYGFKPGKLFGKEVNLKLYPTLIKVSDPQVDFYEAQSTDQKEIYVVLLNNDNDEKSIDLDINSKAFSSYPWKIENISLLDSNGDETSKFSFKDRLNVPIKAYGLVVLKLQIQQ